VVLRAELAGAAGGWAARRGRIRHAPRAARWGWRSAQTVTLLASAGADGAVVMPIAGLVSLPTKPADG
jgi:hypothetical protein